MLLLGIDLGSSSVKASVIDGESGECLASAFYPEQEMKISRPETRLGGTGTGNMVG